jgi:hypothetical protein
VGRSVEITATPSRGAAGSRLTFDVQAIDGVAPSLIWLQRWTHRGELTNG